jgi:hypothetical protein
VVVAVGVTEVVPPVAASGIVEESTLFDITTLVALVAVAVSVEA